MADRSRTPSLSLLDTNPILRHILADHADHSPRADALFAAIERGERWVRTTDTIIFEAAFTLEKVYKVPRPEIARALLTLLRPPGIVLAGKRQYRAVFALYIAHPRLSFADAFHAALAERLGLPSIITFDQYFDRVPGVTREEP
jgi:predicted nucleic acid-binding protein